MTRPAPEQTASTLPAARAQAPPSPPVGGLRRRGSNGRKRKERPLTAQNLELASIAGSFRYIRELRNLTQRELSRLAGVRTTTVLRIEAGDGLPGGDVVSRLLAALGVRLGTFVRVAVMLRRVDELIDGSPPAESAEAGLRGVGKALQLVRAVRQMTVEEVSTRTGHRAATLVEYEEGRRRIRWATLQRVLRALDSDPCGLARAVMLLDPAGTGVDPTLSRTASDLVAHHHIDALARQALAAYVQGGDATG